MVRRLLIVAVAGIFALATMGAESCGTGEGGGGNNNASKQEQNKPKPNPGPDDEPLSDVEASIGKEAAYDEREVADALGMTPDPDLGRPLYALGECDGLVIWVKAIDISIGDLPGEPMVTNPEKTVGVSVPVKGINPKSCVQQVEQALAGL